MKQVDSLIGKIIKELNEIDTELILIITSDHGDLLGEYNLLSHKLVLHDALCHVPMISYGSNKLSQIDDPICQHSDIFATIFSELGLPTEKYRGLILQKKPESS